MYNLFWINKFVYLVLFILLLILSPFVTIWALNTLFPMLNIPYNIQTWMATAILGSVFNLVSYKNNT